MIESTVIHFIRHGEVHNPRLIYYGRLAGFTLSENGRQQARAAAGTLRCQPLAALFCSPLLRATETAEIILAQYPFLPQHISQLLNEVYTPFDGRPASELIERKWDVYTDTESPYEQPRDVLHRAQQFVTEVRRRYVGRQVVAVTHGDVIAFLTLWAKRLPITVKDKQTLYRNYLAHASITTFVYQTTLETEVPAVSYLKPY